MLVKGRFVRCGSKKLNYHAGLVNQPTYLFRDVVDEDGNACDHAWVSFGTYHDFVPGEEVLFYGRVVAYDGRTKEGKRCTKHGINDARLVMKCER